MSLWETISSLLFSRKKRNSDTQDSPVEQPSKRQKMDTSGSGINGFDFTHTSVATMQTKHEDINTPFPAQTPKYRPAQLRATSPFTPTSPINLDGRRVTSPRSSRSYLDRLVASAHTSPIDTSRYSVLDALDQLHEEQVEADFLQETVGYSSPRSHHSHHSHHSQRLSSSSSAVEVDSTIPQQHNSHSDGSVDLEYSEAKSQFMDKAIEDIERLLSEMKLLNPDVAHKTISSLRERGLLPDRSSSQTIETTSMGRFYVPQYELEQELEMKELAEQSVNTLRQLAQKYYESEVKPNIERLKQIQARQRKPTKLPMKTIPESELQIIEKIMIGDDDDIVVSEFNQQVRRHSIRRLRPGQWLDDEIVNFYMQLITERSKADSTLPKVYTFSSFFYSLLSRFDYSRVARWTTKAKIDIFQLDKLLLPIHLGNHWCLAVINFKEKRFEYYDSLGGTNPKCLERLRKYVQDESRSKRNTEIDLSDWIDYVPEDIPHQQNANDCGVFMCKFADYQGRGREYDFDQRHMPYFRKKMVIEILNKRLSE